MNVVIPEQLHPPNVEYQRRLFWTVYCIDRKNAAMLGSTMVVRDEDVSIPFPLTKAGDEVQNVFAIHVTLSSHLGKILDGMLSSFTYSHLGTEAHSLGSYIRSPQSETTHLHDGSQRNPRAAC